MTLEFSSKAFIMRPLQRMLSTHWKRRGWEVGEGGKYGPAACPAWTCHERARVWLFPDKTHPALSIPKRPGLGERGQAGQELPENGSFMMMLLHPHSGGSISQSCSPAIPLWC